MSWTTDMNGPYMTIHITKLNRNGQFSSNPIWARTTIGAQRYASSARKVEATSLASGSSMQNEDRSLQKFRIQEERGLPGGLL